MAPIEKRSSKSSDRGNSSDLDSQWEASLMEVMREVINTLPDETSLGDLVSAARSNAHMAKLMETMTVQDLIDLARQRPNASDRESNTAKSSSNTNRPRLVEDPQDSEDEEFDLGLNDDGSNVIRRRADVPDGDVIILRYFSENGPQHENSLSRGTKLTSEQIRLLLRHLHSKGWVHSEGSGNKRKTRITRSGSGYLRRQMRNRNRRKQ